MPRSFLRSSLLLALATAASAAPAPPVAPWAGPTDYVIVGGGPSGLVIAEYLTRDPRVSVLLLEVGPDSSTDPESYTPARFFQPFQYMWPYFVEPEEILGGRAPDLLQGRALGGGSAVNAMGYSRGAASVFDEWATISGNKGLAWASMREAFKATTHLTSDVHPADQLPVNASGFGTGPLEITTQRMQLAFDRPFADKMTAQFNIPAIDQASGQGIGVTELLASIRADNRTRASAWNTFGWLAAARPNLAVKHGAWVSKIGFTGRTADSVTYNDTATNTTHTVAAREIVLAAGALNSPQLLQLSGVGPAAALRALGIAVVLDAPQVGQNLRDHHLPLLVYETIAAQGTAWQWLHNETAAVAAQTAYAADGSGLLGVPNGNVCAGIRLPDAVFQGLGSFHTSLPADRPHMLYQYSTAPFLSAYANRSTITVFPALVQPEAAGNVSLSSADYRVAPRIHSNYWGTAADKAAVVYAYKELRALMQSDELRSFAPTELFPGPAVISDGDLWRAIQQTSGSFHHPVGTVALGTVLDANWRVRGLRGLRVVGTAAAPKIPTSHTQATAYAMGHRAAVDIVAADRMHRR